MITTTAALQFNQILRQGSLVLTSVLLAKSGLSTADIGVYESLLFVGTTLSYFWLNALIQTSLTFIPPSVVVGCSFGFSRTRNNAFRRCRMFTCYTTPKGVVTGSAKAEATTEATTDKDLEKSRITFNIFLIFNALSLLLFAILIGFKHPISLILTDRTDLPFYELYALFLLLSFPPLLLESLWTVSEKPFQIIVYAIVSHLLLPVLTVLPLWFGKPFEYSFYGMISVAVIRYIWLIINILNQFKISYFSKKIIRSFLLLALPLMAYSFLNGFVTAFSSWIVNWYNNGNPQIFAVFRFGAREFPLTLALATGLSNSIVPKITQNNAEGFAVLKQKSERLWHILFPTSIVLMLTAHWLFPLVFNPSFAKSADIFRLFLLLLTSRALFPQAILLALKETKTMLYISIIETLSIVLLSFLFIKPFNTVLASRPFGEGVAAALVLGFLLEKILIILFLKRRHGIDFQEYTNKNLYFLYSFALVISYFIT